MENREVIIANTRTQKREKIVTNATTLGELKEAMTAAGIDYSGMTFTEGISHTELLDDATQLPKDVEYKGKTTNNLAILLTNTKKNIASGATGSRAEAKELINTTPGLKDRIKAVTGKNWTIVPTETLWSIIGPFFGGMSTETPNEETPSEETVSSSEAMPSEKESASLPLEENVSELKKAVAPAIICNIFNHIALLKQSGVLTLSDCIELSKDLVTLVEEETNAAICDIDDECEDDEEETTSVSTSDGSITEDDIDDMLDELGM